MKILRLSIIIPLYKVEKYVEKCIRSCENQDVSIENYEIIIVNDGSPDGSLTIAKRLAKEYSNLKVISQENGGLSAARNTGMRNAAGEYYMFLDSDDWIAPNCLGKIMKKLRLESPDVLAYAASEVFDDKIEPKVIYKEETTKRGKDLIKRDTSPCAPFYIWKSSFIKKYDLCFYEGIFHEDSEFTPRALYFAEVVSFIRETIYYVYPNPNSITRTVNPKRSFDLVDVVCNNLFLFAKEVDSKTRPVYYDLICMNLNTAISGILVSSKDQQKLLVSHIINKKYLYTAFRNASEWKYKAEYILLRIFSKSPIFVYRLLKTCSCGLCHKY